MSDSYMGAWRVHDATLDVDEFLARHRIETVNRWHVGDAGRLGRTHDSSGFIVDLGDTETPEQMRTIGTTPCGSAARQIWAISGVEMKPCSASMNSQSKPAAFANIGTAAPRR